MYYIAICDDDTLFIRYIKRMLLNAGLDREVKFYEYESGEQLIRALEENIEYDLLILDIQMGKMDGNETARRFRLKHADTILVFCTGTSRPTPQTFKVTPFRYLMKHYSEERMIAELKPVIDLMRKNKEKPYIIGSHNNGTVKLYPEQMLFISVAKRGSDIQVSPENVKHPFEGKIKSDKKVQELYEILKDWGFVHPHNSYIVNAKYIVSNHKKKSMKELQLADGTKLTISRSKAKDLYEALALYWGQKYE